MRGATPTTAIGGAGVGMGGCKEGPAGAVVGACVCSKPRYPGPSPKEVRDSYPLALFATRKRVGAPKSLEEPRPSPRLALFLA
jgi:hypothetical protein